MKNMLMYAMAAGALAVLAACGGGGGDDDASEQPGQPVQPIMPAGPLEKYLGSYSQCDQDHARYTLTMRETADGSYDMVPTEVIYQNGDCTGTVLGTLTWSSPARVRYRSTGVVTARVDGLPPSLSADLIEVTWANARQRLAGPGVTNGCIALPSGPSCAAVDDRNGVTQANLYLSGATLYVLELDNGSWMVELALVRDN